MANRLRRSGLVPGGSRSRRGRPGPNRGCVIKTLEGFVRAAPGDWIIRGVRGELYPCRPDIFDATYEEVRE